MRISNTFEFTNVLDNIRVFPENGGSCDDDFGAGGEYFMQVCWPYAAIDLDLRPIPIGCDQIAQFSNFLQARRNELLTAEARIHTHHQDIIDFRQNLLQRAQWRAWVQCHSRPGSAL